MGLLGYTNNIRYATLAKSGEVQRLETQDLSLVQGLSDQGIQIAIEELKRSTEAIEKQTEMLKLQQNAMSSLVKNEKRIDQARMDIDEEQERKWDIEKGQISSSVSLAHFKARIMLMLID